ncbi:hypothetical protein ENUP19_0138G0015 [Entamoeba nuttalli]|uniref:Uncharacterized protein n=1 Tax=Entamoeba nuttalli TaxID=412467 RepID=A0ABQ0DK43_9EUKA
MKFIVIIVFLFGISQGQCNKSSKGECLDTTGCVWNKKTLMCEEHNLKYYRMTLLDSFLNIFYIIGRQINSLTMWCYSVLEKHIFMILIGLFGCLSFVSVIAIISHFEMKHYAPSKEKIYSKTE